MHRAAGPVEDATPQRAAAWRRGAGYLRAVLARGGATALDLLLPPQCPACGLIVMREVGLCAACWRAMPWIERPYCERLGTPFPFDPGGDLVSAAALADPPAYARARAAARFEGPAQTLVHGLKYHRREDLASPMGRWMARAGRELLADADLLIPVPLHWTRLWRRRFNQSAALARAVSRLTGVPAAPDALLRVRRTPSQVGRSRAERQRNVAGAFRVRPERRVDVEGRAVVLVDDVVTSGATVDACAKALARAGARRVDVLAFARVVTTP